ncbi:MAG: 50S ribosomal protein L10 [Actinobacteria bacterium]|nr:50S ribosomal protein L10 [Actinomycetota bacterium]
MARSDKVDKVKELTERFRSSSGAMFADFRGLTVKDATELRRALRDSDSHFVVVKNTLTRLAARDAGLDGVVPMLEGPTAIAFMGGDPLGGAKALLEMAKRFPALGVKGALVEGQILAEEGARSLATLDAKDVSLGKVAGILQAPLSRITYVLRAPLQRIAFALAERGRRAEAAGGPRRDGGLDGNQTTTKGEEISGETIG